MREFTQKLVTDIACATLFVAVAFGPFFYYILTEV
jgi:hypothetical protein